MKRKERHDVQDDVVEHESVDGTSDGASGGGIILSVVGVSSARCNASQVKCSLLIAAALPPKTLALLIDKWCDDCLVSHGF